VELRVGLWDRAEDGGSARNYIGPTDSVSGRAMPGRSARWLSSDPPFSRGERTSGSRAVYDGVCPRISGTEVNMRE
jgi:hypothetical protein